VRASFSLQEPVQLRSHAPSGVTTAPVGTRAVPAHKAGMAADVGRDATVGMAEHFREADREMEALQWSMEAMAPKDTYAHEVQITDPAC
jgi:hypothetical protein